MPGRSARALGDESHFLANVTQVRLPTTGDCRHEVERASRDVPGSWPQLSMKGEAVEQRVEDMATQVQRCVVYRLPEAFIALSCSLRSDGSWHANGHSFRVPAGGAAVALGDAVARALNRSDTREQSGLRGAAMERMLARQAVSPAGMVRLVVVCRVDGIATVGGASQESRVHESAEQLGDRVRAAFARFG